MKRRTKDKIQTATEALFDILSVGAVVTLTGLLSQGRGAPKMFRKFGAYSAWRIKQMLRRQKLRGMIVYDEDDENAPILLTEKGFSRQKCSALRNFLITSPKKWDHLWRVIIFDISEKRGVRRVFQKHLRAMGCFPLQRSVYAYPYDCIENIKYLAAQYRISAYVTLLTVPHLGQHEKPAREYYFSRFHKHFR